MQLTAVALATALLPATLHLAEAWGKDDTGGGERAQTAAAPAGDVAAADIVASPASHRGIVASDVVYAGAGSAVRIRSAAASSAARPG